MPLQRLGALVLLAAFIGAAAVVAVPEAHAQYFRFGKNKVQYHDLEWHYLQTTHFDVFYYEPGGEALAQFAARAAEEAYAEVARLFDYQLGDRVAILVYQGHNEFAVTNAVDLPAYADGIGGVTEIFKNRIVLPFTGDHREFRRVLHHEIVHAVTNDMFYGGTLQRIVQSGTRLRLPLWFSEGIAEYSALGWDSHSDMYLREAVIGDRIRSVRDLRGYMAYRGGQGFFDFVASEFGREKVTEVLHRVRAGGSVEAGFERALGLSLDDLSRRWVQAMRAVYYPEVAAREDLDAIARPLVTRASGGHFNSAAAISPQGDKVAYLSASGPLFNVYVAETTGEAEPSRLIAGQTNPRFESFRVLSPSLSWNPAGTRLAVAVKAGPGDAIALVDVRTRQSQLHRLPIVDAISAVQWSPDGRFIAASASREGRSDIYLLDLRDGAVTPLTQDGFSNLEPAWAPDGRSIVFHSDRGDHLDTQFVPGPEELLKHDYGQFSLYRLHLDEPDVLERLTADPHWDDIGAAFGSDPDRLLFLSDRNGIHNLYELDLSTRAILPLTDLASGVSQVSLSADGLTAALVALRDGTPSIYLLRRPFERRPEAPLAPTVWAARVMGPDTFAQPPALSVAHATTLRENAFLREAADPTPFMADMMRRKRLPDSLQAAFDAPSRIVFINEESPAVDGGIVEPGTEVDERIDYRDYQFSDAFGDEAAAPSSNSPPPTNSDSATGDDGDAFEPRQYRLRFTPDLIYGNLGYDAVFGVQSFTQMRFSDLLGDHRLTAATNLVIDLRNSDYILSYEYLPQRTDYRVTGFHLARQLTDFTRQNFFRYRNYGLVGAASYPLDRFRRVEAEVSVQGVSLTDLMNPALPSRTRVFLLPALTYTTDVTVPGFLAPGGGHRFAVRVSGSPGLSVGFGTVLADARQYFGGTYYSLALRGAAGISFGPDPQRFFAAGVHNWINPSFEGIPIRDENDFVFGTPIVPLRGYAYDAVSSDRFAMVNAEARFPLVAALLPGPLPVLPLYNLQGVGFVDAAVIPDGHTTLWRREEDDRRTLDDLYIGAGVGLRTLVLGFPIRLDWAWPFDGREFGDGRFYVSVGLDF